MHWIISGLFDCLIIYNVYNGNDEYYDTHDGDDAIDASSDKESANLLEKAAKQLKQAFNNAADKGDDECYDHDENEQKDKEIFHWRLIF